MGTGHERFENGGRILGRHPGRGYTGGRRNPTLVDALPSGHPFSRLIRHAEIQWAYSTLLPQGDSNSHNEDSTRYECMQLN